MLQATQGPLQATLQQTPSVQKPEAHWAAVAHELPSCLSPQRPVVTLQRDREAHCSLLVQDWKQLPVVASPVTPQV